MQPSLGRIVHYVGKHGIHAKRAAIVSCSVADLLPEGDAPGLDSQMHVHLTVFTPSEAGFFPEFNIPYDPEGAPGTWSWPPRVT
jgi:hypothetical protein